MHGSGKKDRVFSQSVSTCEYFTVFSNSSFISHDESLSQMKRNTRSRGILPPTAGGEAVLHFSDCLKRSLISALVLIQLCFGYSLALICVYSHLALCANCFAAAFV